jgi:type IV pilus assembly protein PilC
MQKSYAFAAWGPGGNIERGVLGANDRLGAAEALRERGLRPISVRERGAIFDASKWFTRRPLARLLFFRAFAAFTAAGTSPTETFSLLVQQARATSSHSLTKRLPWAKASAEKFASAIQSVGREVLSGAKLHEAMASRPNEFSHIECAMVEVGEESGELPAVLSRVSLFLERDRKFSKHLSDALTYPMIVILFATIMVIYMVTNLIPQFASLYAGFGVDLPPVMTTLLGISNILRSPAALIGAPLIIGLGLYAFVAYIATAAGALQFDRFRLAIPVVGELIDKIVTARMCDVLAMLSAAGKNPLRALDICIPVTESPVYSRALTQARDLLANGSVADLHEAFVRTEAFEPILTGFVQTGVKAGNLDEMLAKVSEYYEQDVISLTGMIPTVVQTVVTIVLGAIVGLICYAVYIPIAQLVTQIH